MTDEVADDRRRQAVAAYRQAPTSDAIAELKAAWSARLAATPITDSRAREALAAHIGALLAENERLRDALMEIGLLRTMRAPDDGRVEYAVRVANRALATSPEAT